MKKLLLVAVLGVFMLGVVACGGSPTMEGVTNDMVKAIDNYVAALDKVDSKEGVIKAMKEFSVAMKDISERGKKLREADPKAAMEFMKTDAGKKLGESMQKMVTASMKKNVMKFMADPDVQKASKEMQGSMK